MTTPLLLRRRATTWRPTAIANLASWYDASQITGLSDGSNVSTWPDLSGNGHDATQATSSKQPLYKTGIINGGPVVRFDGVDDRLGLDKLTGTTAATVFMVVRKLAVGTSGTYWTGLRLDRLQLLMRMGGNGDVWGAWEQVEVTSGATLGTTAAQITLVQTAGNNVDLVTNGSLVHRTNGTAVPTSSADGQIGSDQSSSTQFSNIDIAELIIYSTALGSTDRAAVEAYLKAKWGTP